MMILTAVRCWRLSIRKSIQPMILFVLGAIIPAACIPKQSCIEFTSLTVGTSYTVGNSFADANVDMTAADFQWGNGQWTNSGHALIDNKGLAGGTAQELNLNNVNLRFGFNSQRESLSLMFGEYGGNLNIDINGDFQNFADFADIDGTMIGRVTVSATNGLGNDQGTLELTGPINSFAIGGQELWIDDVCHQPASDE